jgi:hypothetical protein
MSRRHRRTPLIFWPFVAMWRLVVGLVAFTGRIVGAAVGFVLLVVGALLSATIVGAIVGIPLMIVGAMIGFRAIL